MIFPILRYFAFFLGFYWVGVPVFGFGGPSHITVSSVEQASLRETRSFSGTTLALRTSKVGSPSEGLILKRGIFYGVGVSKDQVILELDSTVQMARLEALRAEQESLYQAYLAKREGSRAEEIEAARSEHRRFEAEFWEAKLQLKRMKDLLAQKATSQELFDEALRDEQVSRALSENAKARLKLMEAGERKEEVLGARARWKAAQARVEEMERMIEKMKIKAPFSGTAGEIFVEVGDWISKGDSIAQLYDSSKIDVVVLVPEELIHQIPMRSSVICRFQALGGKSIQGVVVSKGPATTQAGRTVPLVARFPNENSLIKPGMSVEAQLQIGEEKSALWVDKDAILHGGPGGPSVYVHLDGKVQPRPVGLGRTSGSKVEILKGLSEGEEVVTRGNERLRPGAEVVVARGSQSQ